MKNKLLLLFLVMIATIISCKPYTKWDQLKEVGVLGTHELHRIEQTAGINGNMTGSFFFVSGSVSGQISSGRQLQFYWGRNKNEVISTTLPYSAFLFLIDSTETVPTVEFVYSPRYLAIDDNDLGNDSYAKEDLNHNPNAWLTADFINAGNLQQAVVRISRADMDKEIYLPK